jgi:cytochrome oxidase Cu insertion factor (SCO1/SenC/PrrC family)
MTQLYRKRRCLSQDWCKITHNAITKAHEGGRKHMQLQVGQLAPDFTLPTHLGKTLTLSDLRGKNVVMAFYPLAWTPV